MAWLRWWIGALVLLAATSARAQGVLRVVVVDYDNAPIPSVDLTLSGPTLLGSSQQRATDEWGEATFRDLPSGAYRLAASRSGYDGVVIDGIEIRPGRTVSQPVQLAYAASTGAESIVVETTTTGLSLTTDFLQKVPAGRSYQSAVGSSGGRGGKRAAAEAPAAAPPPQAAPAPPPSPTAPPPEPGAPASTGRMDHYDGWASLSVNDPDGTLDHVIAVALAAGGRTELLSGRTVTVRVPVARFREVWDEVLGLGEVLDQSVRSEDITDQYTAIDLRIRMLTGTRDRLIALLAKAQTEMEKLQLIQEIADITEELDVLQAQLGTLSDLAAMSRITVVATARPTYVSQAQRQESAGLEWVRALSPFRRGVWADDHRVELPLPEQMVALNPRGPYIAESPGGTVAWAMRLENDPLGSAEFWASTIQDRIAAEFAAPTRQTLGPWECLALDEPQSEAPYRWQICVRTEGRKLFVAQMYYPDADQRARYADAMDQLLRGGGA